MLYVYVGVKNNQQLLSEIDIRSTQLISKERETIHNKKSKQQIKDEKWLNQIYIYIYIYICIGMKFLRYMR